MLIIPVMYIRGGLVLTPSATGGTSPTKSDPFELAHDWFKASAELIHVVDLDAPPAGPSPNISVLHKIKTGLKLEFEIEGNIRASDTVERYIAAGASRVVIGTSAYQKPAFLTELCKKFPKKITTVIDVRRGKVIIKGWAVASNKSDLDYVKQFKEAGVDTIFYSNCEEEGYLKVTDISNIREFLRKSMIKVFHTLDASSAHDIENIMALESYGLQGTLLSRSLYEGRIDLESAITLVKERSPGSGDEPTYTESA
ncbi:MAG: hypothetical protein COV46_02130 [Deltaproteobacteria bacterium CG11_big_fil_rev_8_21_14_0_20_49_13]|nr:MAG: hypothetical protein COV46_02130 [Deltaproteobacteria bacterium CG11_big_fil_rev_8_21_14_0_20_49_13]